MLAVLRSSVSLTFERVGYADPGMTRLKAEIGLPFKAHAGTWSNGRGNDTKNPYYTVPEYKFVVEGGGAVPQGPGLWDHVFSYARSAFSVPLTVWLTVARFCCLAAAKTTSRSTSKRSSRTVSATHICPCSHPFLCRRTLQSQRSVAARHVRGDRNAQHELNCECGTRLAGRDGPGCRESKLQHPV